MEKITELKAKYLKIDTSEINHLLSQVEIVDEVKKNQDQQFNEDESKIKELTSKLNIMKETLSKETVTLEQKKSDLSKLNNYFEELETERKKVLQEIKQLEKQQNNIKSAKPNILDQQLMQQGRKKLGLYKDLTRIHWDYGATKSSIQGYVSNQCDYIHQFCYISQEINEELIESLWHQIYLSTDEASKVRESST